MVEAVEIEAPPSANGTKRRSLVDEAYDSIKAQILNNEMPPGGQHLERDVAATLGMSRTPMREALVRLQDDGLIEILPRRGFRVRPISPDDMREIYQLLYCLESTAVELLAARQLPAESPEIAALEAATREMETSLNDGDLDGWAAADEQFHRLLLQYCGNKRLAKMAFTVWDQSNRARMVTLRLRPIPTDSTADHMAVVDAIRRHDASGARQMHEAHRLRGMNTLMGILETYRLNHL